MLPDKEIKTDFSNQTSIKDVKIQFVQKMKESDLDSNNIDADSLRFIYCGKELKDDLFLYSYNI